MANVEVQLEISDVFINSTDKEKREFVDSYDDELYEAMSNKSGFIKEHLEDADEDDIVEFLRNTGRYNIEEL